MFRTFKMSGTSDPFLPQLVLLFFLLLGEIVPRVKNNNYFLPF
jgi:hypothetical protein